MKSLKVVTVIGLALLLMAGLVSISVSATNVPPGLFSAPANMSPLANTLSISNPYGWDQTARTFKVDILLDDGINVGGFETDVTYDGSIITATGFITTTYLSSGTAAGRDQIRLGPLVDPGQMALGVATCPVSPCSADPSTNPPRNNTGASGPGALATVILQPAFDPGAGGGLTTLSLSNYQLVAADASVQTVATAGPINIGVMDFKLVPGKYMIIGVPMDMSSAFSNASELYAFLGGSAKVTKLITFLNGELLSYPPTDFGVTLGTAVLLRSASGGATHALMAGPAASGWTNSLAAGTATKCKYNPITVPFEFAGSITDAPALENAINTKAGLDIVTKIVTFENGELLSYPPTPFSIGPGNGYLVCANANTPVGFTWP